MNAILGPDELTKGVWYKLNVFKGDDGKTRVVCYLVAAGQPRVFKGIVDPDAARAGLVRIGSVWDVFEDVGSAVADAGKWVGQAAKDVVKSDITAAIVTGASVIFPPVGVPAAAAYATARSAVAMLETGEAAVNTVSNAVKAVSSSAGNPKGRQGAAIQLASAKDRNAVNKASAIAKARAAKAKLASQKASRIKRAAAMRAQAARAAAARGRAAAIKARKRQSKWHAAQKAKFAAAKTARQRALAARTQAELKGVSKARSNTYIAKLKQSKALAAAQRRAKRLATVAAKRKSIAKIKQARALAEKRRAERLAKAAAQRQGQALREAKSYSKLAKKVQNAPTIQEAVEKAEKVREMFRKISLEAKRGNPDAIKTARIINIVATNRDRLKGLAHRHLGGQPGIVVDDKGRILKGKWVANPSQERAEYMIDPMGISRGEFSKIAGCACEAEGNDMISGRMNRRTTRSRRTKGPLEDHPALLPYLKRLQQLRKEYAVVKEEWTSFVNGGGNRLSQEGRQLSHARSEKAKELAAASREFRIHYHMHRQAKRRRLAIKHRKRLRARHMTTARIKRDPGTKLMQLKIKKEKAHIRALQAHREWDDYRPPRPTLAQRRERNRLRRVRDQAYQKVKSIQRRINALGQKSAA